MDPTEEQLERIFGHEDGSRRVDFVIMYPVPGKHPFLREGSRLLDKLAVTVYFDPAKHVPDGSVFEYLGELLAPPDFRLDCLVRDELRLITAPASFPKPPRSLGRSIPARQAPVRGAKLTCGGWR